MERVRRFKFKFWNVKITICDQFRCRFKFGLELEWNEIKSDERYLRNTREGEQEVKEEKFGTVFTCFKSLPSNEEWNVVFVYSIECFIFPSIL